MVVARRVVAHGKVQGVFYRDWTVKTARALGLSGWVRNEADGTVTAHVEGDEGALKQLIDSMRSGPPAARVERLEVSDAPPVGAGGFVRK